jgi:hypothetical protein
MFSSDMFKKFLRDLLVNCNFPDGAITLHTKEMEEGGDHDESKQCEHMDHL